jgi:UrcA family protein
MRLAGICTAALAGAIFVVMPLASGPAFAQGQAGAQATENVIVRAPIITTKPAPQSGSGLLAGRLAPTPEIVSMTRAVSYRDLDLSRASGVSALEDRVRNTARDVCQDLFRQFPNANARINYPYPSRDCVRKATFDGMQSVRRIRAGVSRR